ncbi:MAG: Maf family protein [bacterium]
MLKDIPLFLASQSPRRKKLLKILNLKFKSFSVDVDESLLPNETPLNTVLRLSEEKLNKAKLCVKNGVILTADTIVVLDGEIINKPKDKKDAEKILKKLSGNTHTVFTGFALFNSKNNKTILDYETTEVTFRKLTKSEILDYIKTGSPMDKAGAYGIQDDYGAVFIEKINGCYYNVVGLPLQKVYQKLKEII